MQGPPPTSTLFPYTTLFRSVMNVIRDLASQGMTMLVVTHEMQLAHDIATRVWVIDRGTIVEDGPQAQVVDAPRSDDLRDRKSTRLNSSHVETSYAVFCLKKK